MCSGGRAVEHALGTVHVDISRLTLCVCAGGRAVEHALGSVHGRPADCVCPGGSTVEHALGSVHGRPADSVSMCRFMDITQQLDVCVHETVSSSESEQLTVCVQGAGL